MAKRSRGIAMSESIADDCVVKGPAAPARLARRLRWLCPILLGVAVTTCADQPMADRSPAARESPMSVMMMLQNSAAPFVSSGFAERLARLVIDEKYSSKTFKPLEDVESKDAGDAWRVTLTNELATDIDSPVVPMVGGVPTSQRLTIVIRKRDAAIIDIQ